jgi:O-antigen/teichoic acid export membrane protein
MSVRQRILSALAANAFGQAVTIGTQILLTPLFFANWGAALYGEWLLLSAVLAYLTMADLGIGSAAGNEMTMRAGANDYAGAQQTYRGAFWIAGWTSLIVLLVGLVFAGLKQATDLPGTRHIDAATASLVLLLLAGNVGLSFFGGVFSAGYRCAGRNATGILLGNCSRLTEGVLTGALLLAGQGPLSVCLGMLLIKAGFLVAQAWHLPRLCPWLYTPRARADTSLARRLIKPSLAFMALPAAGALSLQGPILVLGAALGGEVVAMFSAMRTLSRIPIQITGVLNASVWPEMSRAFGAGRLDQVRRLHRRSASLSAALVVCSCLVLALLGETISQVWLGQRASFDPAILNWLLAVSTVSAIWNASSIVLASTNRHAQMGIAMVLSSGLSLLAGWALVPSIGLHGQLGALFFAEVVMLLIVVPQALSCSGDTLSNFWLRRDRSPH